MKRLVSYVFVFVLGFAACAWILKSWGYTRPTNGDLSIPESGKRSSLTVVRRDENPIADAAERVGPAVVNIDTVSEIRSPLPPPLEQLFGIPRSEVRGLGSGVIIRRDGYILTNNHVVQGADKITVRLADRRTFNGRVVGRDQRSDLAVIKIDGKNLPVAVMGDSDALRVGDWVIAIGNPLGLSNTVTVGIISAPKRTDLLLPNGNVLEEVIQTDAAINQGNSGGALVNIHGEVIGINSVIYSDQGGGSIGIGFAIPINSAKSVVKQLIEKGEVVRPWIGLIMPEDLTGDMLEWYRQNGYKRRDGVLITQVAPDSPAERAGLMRGDVLMEIDSKEIKSASQLIKILQKYKVGGLVRLTIWRAGQVKLVGVRLAKMPAIGD